VRWGGNRAELAAGQSRASGSSGPRSAYPDVSAAVSYSQRIGRRTGFRPGRQGRPRAHQSGGRPPPVG
jgi:hypothetical protein